MAAFLLNDVLRSVLAYLNPDDLTALARSSRHFVPAVQEHLYRNVEISSERGADQLQFLYRTLSESPVLSNMVRNVVIDLQSTSRTVLEQVRALLVMLGSVQSIYMQIHPSSPASDLLEGCLTSILVNLASLRELRLHWREFPDVITESIPMGSCETLPLQTLEIQSGISLAAFYRLIHPLHSLKSLNCMIPGTRGPYSSRSMIDQLSPFRIFKSLEPTKVTLTELRLYSGDQHWPTNDGTRLDLSSFTALKILDIPHLLLFCSPGPDPSRDGTYLLLPPNLEHLKVCTEDQPK